MGFNIGPKYELAVLVIIKILAHDYISWGIHIRYPIFRWLLIEPEPNEPNYFNDDSTWGLLEWESVDKCSCVILDYAILVLNLLHMIIYGGGINICFLME